MPNRLIPAYADGRAVRPIILDLLTNALEYTGTGGRVTVSASDSDDHVIIRVADTGIGIPVDRLPGLATPFTRVQSDPYNRVEEWGLGLAVTKSLIELYDGKLDIDSKVGEGPTVTVRLPLCP